MNNKGQIGQIITSLVILFVVFFLMLIFVIVSGNIAGVLGLLEKDARPGEFVAPSSQAIGSQVLMELFLTDSVEINGENFLVVDALREIIDADEDRAKILAQAIQDMFHEDYSCEEKNVLLLVKYTTCGLRGDPCALSYLDYPNIRVNENNFPAREGEVIGYSEIFGSYPQNKEGEKEGYYTKSIGKTSKFGEEFLLTIKENVRC